VGGIFHVFASFLGTSDIRQLAFERKENIQRRTGKVRMAATQDARSPIPSVAATQT
jgi:hypothetical protein